MKGRLRLSICILALVTQFLGAAVPSAGSFSAVRLAIIADSPSASSLVDFLTAEFSRQPTIQLLERTEIERILGEQKLIGGRRDYLKLGKLLGAQGLLLLQNASAVPGGELELRLVAVNPGVVIGSIVTPEPTADEAQLAAWIRGHFEPLVPKLQVSGKDAVPISILNFRSSLQSPEAKEFDQLIARLAVQRLTRQPELFVLERRGMNLLSTEREIQGIVGETNFWSGTWLVEGSLDPESYSQEAVTLKGRLIPPQRGSPVAFELSASRTNLNGLVDRLADKIVATLKLAHSPLPWNTAEEAERYFREAQWAYRWRALGAAASACEASRALGKETRELAELRIRAYSEAGVDRATAACDLQRKIVTFAPATVFTGGFLPQELAAAAGYPPANDKFVALRRAMEVFCQDYRLFVASNANPGWAWYDLGLDILESASFWLRHYYYMPEARIGQEQTIAGVQGLAREMAGLLGSHPAFTNCFGRSDYFAKKVNWGAEPLGESQRHRNDLPTLKASCGAYWFATPEQGLEVYRGIIDAGGMPWVRGVFIQQDFLEQTGTRGETSPYSRRFGGTLTDMRPLSYLTGWKWEDRQRVLIVWHNFIDELCASTNQSVKLEGLFLRCAHSPRDSQHAQAFADMLSFLEQFPQAARNPAAANLTNHIEALLAWRTGPSTNLFRARDDQWRKFKGATTPVALVSSPVLSAPSRPTSPTSPASPMAGLFNPRTSGTPSFSLSNALEVTQFCALPENPFGSNSPAAPSIASCCYREGRFWVEVRFDHFSSGQGDRSFFNLGGIYSFASDFSNPQFIPLNFESFTLSARNFAAPPDRLFEVAQGALYVSSANVIRCYSFSNRTWKSLPVPVQGYARFSLVHNRLFAGTEDSILELTGETTRVVASRRRQPPQNLLDSAGAFRLPSLFPGPGESLFALVGGALYQQTGDGQHWARSSSQIAPEYAVRGMSDDGLVLTTQPGLQGKQIFVLFRGEPRLDLALIQPVSPMRRVAFPPISGTVDSSRPRWSWPEGLRALNYGLALQGQALLLLSGALAPPRGPVSLGVASSHPSEAPAVLFGFLPNRNNAVAIPLKFIPIPNPVCKGFQFVEQFIVEPTPRGLLIASSCVPGFWLIPQHDLLLRLNEPPSGSKVGETAVSLGSGTNVGLKIQLPPSYAR